MRQVIREDWEPISDDPAPQWVAENVALPADSELKSFDFELFPLARFALEQLCHNEHLRRFTEMLSAQVGKTVTILAYVCWKIINRPTSIGWYTDTGINAKHDYKTKILPTLESCAKVAKLLPADRAKKNNTLVQFGFMNLRVMGAESRSNREGKTIAEVLCDEVRNYPPGAMQQIDNRFKTVTNWRRVLFSSAGDLTNEPWLSFKKGTQHLGFWPCPKCGHKQTFRFGRKASPLYPGAREKGGFVWADNEKTHPDDFVYNFLELLPTVEYECEQCGQRFKESDKLDLIRRTEFVQTNPMADPSDVSVHCWEAYMPFAGCSWGSIVMKFLNALVAMKQGSIEPMRVFVTETLGEPWEDLGGEKPVEGEIMERCGEYAIGEMLSGPDVTLVLTADYQHGYVVYVLRQHRKDGYSRLIEWGKVLDFDELREYQTVKGVKDRAVWIDCAYRPNDVYEACLKYGRWTTGRGGERIWDGWTPMIGDDAEEFTRMIEGGSVKSFWKRSLIDPAVGTSEQGRRLIPRYSWSNNHYKEKLYIYTVHGRGLPWEIPKNIDREYVKQLSVTERIPVTDASGQIIGHEWREKGRHDAGDCELEQLVVADIAALVRPK